MDRKGHQNTGVQRCLLVDEQGAAHYLPIHRARLAGLGIEDSSAMILDSNVTLIRIDHGWPA